MTSLPSRDFPILEVEVIALSVDRDVGRAVAIECDSRRGGEAPLPGD